MANIVLWLHAVFCSSSLLTVKDPIALSSPASLPIVSTEETPFDAARPRPSWQRTALIAGGTLAGLLLVVAGGSTGAYAVWAGENRIAPGVFIAGQNVGGLTEAQAQKRLEMAFGRVPVAIEIGGQTRRIALRELGGKPSAEPTTKKAFAIGRNGSTLSNLLRVYDSRSSGQRFMLPIEWNKSRLVEKLKTLDADYRIAPKNARLVVDEGGSRALPETRGRELNVGETARLIQSKYFVGARQAIAVASREVEPQITAASLDGRDELLGTYRTTFDSGLIGRTTNIRVACERIDGRVLMPGEEFSFNKSTGERTWHKGYRMAHIFERKPGATESEVVDGLAGGVCQVSSTLFNAVRKTNGDYRGTPLKIVERSSHSLPVTYVPRGLDATVAWPYKDFRFRNSFDYPVFLRTAMGRSRLRIEVWAHVPRDSATRIASAQ